MKPYRSLVMVRTAAVFSLAYANTKKAWDGGHSPSTVRYLIYSNDLDEAQAPTRTDQRISVAITGDLARQMFDSIGPDLKVACGMTLRMRQRQRGDVDCSYDKDQLASPYTSHAGQLPLAFSSVTAFGHSRANLVLQYAATCSS
jgi:hypothetical protein